LATKKTTATTKKTATTAAKKATKTVAAKTTKAAAATKNGVCQLSETLTLVIDGVRMGTMMVPCKGSS